jgi:hypothetical protein
LLFFRTHYSTIVLKYSALRAFTAFFQRVTVP